MATRTEILDDFKTCLGKISKENGYNQDVAQVVRAFLPYERVFKFPVLMVLGGGEVFDPLIDGDVRSTFSIIIRGYTRDVDNPEETSCNLIKDVLKVLESSYNTHADIMDVVSLNTDEGWFSVEYEGASMFEILIQVAYHFDRRNP